MDNFELGGGSDFAFTHSKIAGQGLTETKRIETASVVVAVDESGDFQSIQEAINALNGNGGYIQVKEGTYNIKETINIGRGVTITGTGDKTILLKDAAITNIINLTNSDVKIEKLTFEGISTLGVFSGVGVETTTVYDNRIIKDCNFNKLDKGINLTGAMFQISGNKFERTETGIYLKGVQFGTIIGNTFDNNNGGDTFIESGGEVGGTESISITGNMTFANYAYKGHEDDYKVQITGNNFSEDALILIEGENCLVVGNISSTITDNGTGSTIANNGN